MDYPRSDRWGRPLIVPDGDSREVPHTRVTTVAKTLDGQEGLTRWKGRMTAGGAALRPDILAQVAATWPPTEANKAQLDGYVEELKEAAAASAGANAGDAHHQVMARVWRGEVFRPIPPFDATVEVIGDLLEKAHLRPVPDWVERTVVLPEETVAGSFDLLVETRAGQLFVADLKTGKDLELAWPSIAIQLALYSRASTLYDWEARTHAPMPEVNQYQGLVIWLPAFGKKASLHVVDLRIGWEAAQLALEVRAYRTRKDLARPARVNGRTPA